MELNAVLAKVRKLTAIAEHSATPPAEASACSAKADALMLEYAIEQADLDEFSDRRIALFTFIVGAISLVRATASPVRPLALIATCKGLT